MTLKCRPAIVSVPARGGPVVGATVKETAAEPLPFAPDVIAIQSASDAAVHAQSALDAPTSTLPVPPACDIDAEPGVAGQVAEQRAQILAPAFAEELEQRR